MVVVVVVAVPNDRFGPYLYPIYILSISYLYPIYIPPSSHLYLI